MVTKALVKNCDCTHCKEKLEQINRSRAYWERKLLKN